jgi:lysozyme family protein
VANKVFDLTVNMGPVALKLLQSAVNASGGQCAVDGVLGPISIRQINALNADQLLAHYKRLAAQRYQRIAADNTELAGDLTAWLARLNS